MGGRLCFRPLALLFLVFGGLDAAALEIGSPVPLFSPKQAMRLSSRPVARMVSDTICERIAGLSFQDRYLVAGGTVALFRSNNRKEPFMRIVSREDGVTVARFPAVPGEVIYGRGYVIDPDTGKERYGSTGRAVCEPMRKVVVGELSKVESSEPRSSDSGENEQP